MTMPYNLRTDLSDKEVQELEVLKKVKRMRMIEAKRYAKLRYEKINPQPQPQTPAETTMATEAQYPPLAGDTKEVNDVRIGLIGTCKDIQKGKAILAEVRYKEWKKQQANHKQP